MFLPISKLIGTISPAPFELWQRVRMSGIAGIQNPA